MSAADLTADEQQVIGHLRAGMAVESQRTADGNWLHWPVDRTSTALPSDGMSPPMTDIILHPLEGVALETRDAWVEMVEILADWTPDAPLESGLPERLLALLFAPLGTEAASAAGDLRAAAYTRHHTVSAADDYAADVERTVEAVITRIQDAPRLRPSTGGSPTAGEGVTGAVEGAAPVTPAGGAS